jgi:hypothetical protein
MRPERGDPWNKETRRMLRKPKGRPAARPAPRNWMQEGLVRLLDTIETDSRKVL